MLQCVLITQDDPLYLPQFFGAFLPHSATHDDVRLAGVVIQPPLGSSASKLLKRLLNLYGPGGFGKLLAKYAKARARRPIEGALGAQSLRGLCAEHGVSVLPFVDVNTEPFVSWLQDHDIDVLVSVAASQIIGKATLDAPRVGAINVHNGRLPEYRGMMPTFWQMLRGEPGVTTTVHTMAEKLDMGVVVREDLSPIRAGDTLDSVIRRAKRQSAASLWSVLDDLAAGGDLAGRAIDPSQRGSYYGFPGREHARAFRDKGFRFF